MSLKDLTVNIDQIAEEALENALGDYIRYDPSKRVITLTLLGQKLDQKKKVLVYLLAQKGWKFVLDDIETEGLPPEGAKPKDLGGALNIGDSIRPVLKNLRDDGLVTPQEDGSYMIPDNLVLEIIDVLKESKNGEQ